MRVGVKARSLVLPFQPPQLHAMRTNGGRMFNRFHTSRCEPHFGISFRSFSPRISSCESAVSKMKTSSTSPRKKPP